MSVKIVEVDVDNEGRRLDNYLISYLKDIPKSKINIEIAKLGRKEIANANRRPININSNILCS